MEDLRELKQWVISFLEVAQADVEALSEGDRIKHFYHLDKLLDPARTLYQCWKRQEIETQLCSLDCGPEYLDKEREARGWDEWGVSMSWIEDMPKYSDEDFAKVFASTQVVLRGMLAKLFDRLNGEKGTFVHSFKMRWNLIANGEGGYIIFDTAVAGTLAEYLLGMFMYIVVRTGKKLSKCEECGALFLQAGAKPKRYCSVKCGWKANARRRREADPEAYRARQREVMRKRYEAKRKQELGPSVKVRSRKKEG